MYNCYNQTILAKMKSAQKSSAGQFFVFCLCLTYVQTIFGEGRTITYMQCFTHHSHNIILYDWVDMRNEMH